MSIPRVFEQVVLVLFCGRVIPLSLPPFPLFLPSASFLPDILSPGRKKRWKPGIREKGDFSPGPFSSSWRHDEGRGTEGGESLLLPFLPVYLFSLRISLLSLSQEMRTQRGRGLSGCGQGLGRESPPTTFWWAGQKREGERGRRGLQVWMRH